MKWYLFLIIFLLGIDLILAFDDNDFIMWHTFDNADVNATHSKDYYNGLDGEKFSCDFGATGVVDECVEFNRNDIFDRNYINISYNDKYNFSSSDHFTIGFWFNIIKPWKDDNALFYNINPGYTLGWRAFVNDLDQTLRINFYDSNGHNDNLRPNAKFNSSTWYCLVIIHDTVNNKTIWINGSEVSYSLNQNACNGNYYVDHGLIIGDDPMAAAGAYDWNGTLDEFFISNKTFSGQEVKDYCAKTQPPFSSDVTPPNITISQPGNHTFTNNNSVMIKINISEAGTCYINDSNWVNLFDNGQNFTWQRNNTPDGNYSIFFNCNDTSDNQQNTSIWFIVDTTYPTIIWDNPSNFSIHNSNFELIINYSDDWLFKTNTTIFYSNGTKVYNKYSGILDNVTTYYNFTYNIIVGNGTWDDDEYYVFAEAVDTHTAYMFNAEFNIKQGKDYYMYVFPEGNITFKLPSNVALDTIKTYDRWKQKYTYTKILNDLEMEIEFTNDNVHYIKNSPYNCHLVIFDRYWYDCEGINFISAELSKNIFRYRYTPNLLTDVTDSLGGLNYIASSLNFTIDATTPTASYNVTNGSTSIVWDWAFSETINYTYWVGLNCSDNSVDSGSDTGQTSLQVNNIGLSSSTTYWFNITILDQAGNHNNYCVNGTTLSGGGGCDCSVIQSYINTVRLDIDELEESNMYIALALFIMVTLTGFLGIAYYVNNLRVDYEKVSAREGAKGLFKVKTDLMVKSLFLFAAFLLLLTVVGFAYYIAGELNDSLKDLVLVYWIISFIGVFIMVVMVVMKMFLFPFKIVGEFLESVKDGQTRHNRR